MKNNNQFKNERKIAIYVRESTKRQAEEGYNIEVQEEKCLQYMKLKDFTENYNLYKEKGVSAKTTHRPQLNALKKDIINYRISKLIVYKLDRLVRRLKGLSEIMELCEKYKVELISVKEEFDSTSLIGRMMINFTIMLAQWEQDIISERTVEALRYGAEQGSYIIGNKPPFGYQREIVYRESTGTKLVRLIPILDEFEIVKKIFRYSEDGYNNSEIKSMINSMPYMVSNELKFDDRRIENILRNKIYCGIMVVKNQEFNIELEKVLSLECWQKIQQNRSIHFKSDEKNIYPFKGKVYDEKGVVCTVDVTNKRTKNGAVRKYYYYESPASKKRINQSKINEKVQTELEILYNKQQYEVVQETLRRKLNKCLRLRDNLYKLYLNDKISDDIYNFELQRVNDDVKYMKECLNIRKKKYEELSDKERNIYMRNAIKRIQVNMQTQVMQIVYS